MSAEAMPGKQILLSVLLLFARNAVEVLMIAHLGTRSTKHFVPRRTCEHKRIEITESVLDVGCCGPGR